MASERQPHVETHQLCPIRGGVEHLSSVVLRPSQSTLAHVHGRFLLHLEGLAEFWSVLDEIDEQTWVLEPEKPSRADTMRRIAIGNHA